MFIRTFGCYIMESAEAKALREEAMKIEGSLESSRNTMKLGADLPDKGFTEMSSVQLATKMRTEADEGVRKMSGADIGAVLGGFVVENGFLEVVKVSPLYSPEHPCVVSGTDTSLSIPPMWRPISPVLTQYSRRGTKWRRRLGMRTTTTIKSRRLRYYTCRPTRNGYRGFYEVDQQDPRGFNKKRLFEILVCAYAPATGCPDTLEVGTRDLNMVLPSVVYVPPPPYTMSGTDMASERYNAVYLHPRYAMSVLTLRMPLPGGSQSSRQGSIPLSRYAMSGTGIAMLLKRDVMSDTDICCCRATHSPRHVTGTVYTASFYVLTTWCPALTKVVLLPGEGRVCAGAVEPRLHDGRYNPKPIRDVRY
eukprot:605034-Rhodomonas_salina.2